MVDAPPQRGVKTRIASLPSPLLQSGLSVLTPRLTAGRWKIEPERQRRLVEL